MNGTFSPPQVRKNDKGMIKEIHSFLFKEVKMPFPLEKKAFHPLKSKIIP